MVGSLRENNLRRKLPLKQFSDPAGSYFFVVVLLFLWLHFFVVGVHASVALFGMVEHLQGSGVRNINIFLHVVSVAQLGWRKAAELALLDSSLSQEPFATRSLCNKAPLQQGPFVTRPLCNKALRNKGPS